MIRSYNGKPMVSIIIPVYNGQNYLKDALQSCIRQSYKNIEILVVDDGSQDDTPQIVKQQILIDSRIKYLHKKNGGVASALNLGLKNATGEYFSWLSHDDIYDENKIKYQLEVAENNLKNTIVHCNYSLIDKNSEHITNVDVKNHNFLDFETNPLYALFQSSINGCCLLIPKSIYKNNNFHFNENLLTTQDYDLWFKLFQTANLVHMDQYLVKYRVHAGQDSLKSPNLISENELLWSHFAQEIFDEIIWTGPQDSKVVLAHLVGHLFQTKYRKSLEKTLSLLYTKLETDILKLRDPNYSLLKVENNQLRVINPIIMNNLDKYYRTILNYENRLENINFIMMLLSGTSLLVDSSCKDCKNNNKSFVIDYINFDKLFRKKIKIYLCMVKSTLNEVRIEELSNFIIQKIFYDKKLICIDCDCVVKGSNLFQEWIISSKKLQKIILNKLIFNLNTTMVNRFIYIDLVKIVKYRFKILLTIKLIFNWVQRRIQLK